MTIKAVLHFQLIRRQQIGQKHLVGRVLELLKRASVNPLVETAAKPAQVIFQAEHWINTQNGFLSMTQGKCMTKITH